MRYKLQVWYTDGSSTILGFDDIDEAAEYIATSEQAPLVVKWEITDTGKKRKRTEASTTKKRQAARRLLYEDYHPGDDTIH